MRDILQLRFNKSHQVAMVGKINELVDAVNALQTRVEALMISVKILEDDYKSRQKGSKQVKKVKGGTK